MADSLMKQKLVQYFNEALAMENAAVDRNQTRMSETDTSGKTAVAISSRADICAAGSP
jgi:hypothetical protein